jgi:hypothetical protein
MPAMQVRFQFQGLNTGLNQLNQLARAMRQNNQLAAALGAGGGGAGGGGNVNVYNYRGGGSGNAPRRSSTFGSRLVGMLGSTRLNMGVASPLLGRMAGLAGAGASGPLTIAAAATIGPIVALGAAAKASAASLMEIKNAMTTSGGGAGDFRRLAAFGNPAELAGRANQFRERASSDPQVMAMMARLGLGRVLAQPFGTTNNAEIYARTLEKIAAIPNPVEQLRAARVFGAEDLIEKMKVSPDIQNARKADATRMAGVMNPKAIQNARDFNALLEDTSRLFGETVATFASQFGGEASLILRAFNDTMRSSMGMVTDFGKTVRDTIRQYLIEPAFYLAALLHFKDINAAQVSLDTLKKTWMMQDALASQNQPGGAAGGPSGGGGAAMMGNGGFYGGGSRARGALPPMLRGQSFNDAIDGRTLSFGSWSL